MPKTNQSHKLYVVRHAIARNRDRWQENDLFRPLTEKGRRQADVIVEQYGGFRCQRIVSSPARRCVETVGPLSQSLGVELETNDTLKEGTDPLQAFSFLVQGFEQLGDDGSFVACTHGDLLSGFLEILDNHGALPEGDPFGVPKAATLAIEVRDGEPVSARLFRAPPV